MQRLTVPAVIKLSLSQDAQWRDSNIAQLTPCQDIMCKSIMYDVRIVRQLVVAILQNGGGWEPSPQPPKRSPRV